MNSRRLAALLWLVTASACGTRQELIKAQDQFARDVIPESCQAICYRENRDDLFRRDQCIEDCSPSMD